MKIIIQNLAINYQDVGTGPVVVVLHGWGTSAANMKPVIDQLSATYRVIAPDFPGFGASERPRDAWFVGDYGQFVAALLEKLGVKEVYALIGHSFGGRVTIKSAGEGILHPEKIILIGSAGIKHSNSFRNTVYKAIAKVGKAIFSLPGLSKLSNKARERLYRSAGSTDYAQANEMKDIFSNTINEDLQQSAAKIAQPALLIWGEHDHEAPVADAERFHELIKQSELIVVPGAGHFVHTEKSAKVGEAINKFL